MLTILELILPALTPVLIYIGWCLVRARKKARGEEVPHITKHMFVTIVATLIIAAACFLLIGIEQSPNETGRYRPAVLNKDGTLTPGHFE